MDKLNQLFEEKNSESNVTGNWFSIQWTPDLYSNERLNVGVGLIEPNGDLSVQLLDDYERVNCLFSNKNVAFQLELACSISREMILKNEIFKKEITPQIHCEINGFAQGKSTDEILNQLFLTVVTLGKKVNKKRAPNFASRSRDTIYNNLRERLKVNLNLDYSKCVPVNPFYQLQRDKYEHNLYLPFRNNSGVGTLVSAAYADTQRVKCNLNDGFWDLDIYSQKFLEQKNSIFLLLPDETLKDSHKILIDNELDKFTWFMRTHGIHVGAHVNSDMLADEISTWCLSAA
jgi:hypothetical protein